MESFVFDVIAEQYDSTFTNTLIGREYRNAVWKEFQNRFQPGNHLLDLGCGTGEDAHWMAAKGMRITAVDASSKMLQVAQNRRQVSASPPIRFQQINLAFPDRTPLFEEIRFDGAYSNFGALNCLEDYRNLSQKLGQCLKAGGYLVVVIMGPFCLWETLWFLAHLQTKKAFRRLNKGKPASIGDGKTIRAWYPTPNQTITQFSDQFSHIKTIGIGSLLPPPYLDHLFKKRETLFQKISHLEDRVRVWNPLAWISDHYLMVLQRSDSTRF